VCARYHQPTRPEEEGNWALPHGEFGLDVIALVGALRFISIETQIGAFCSQAYLFDADME
jgi:hypothetical protein